MIWRERIRNAAGGKDGAPAPLVLVPPGGIRSTFEAIPDAPLTKVVLEMQGAKKGLLVNSTDICKAKGTAEVKLSAHSGSRGPGAGAAE